MSDSQSTAQSWPHSHHSHRVLPESLATPAQAQRECTRAHPTCSTEAALQTGSLLPLFQQRPGSAGHGCLEQQSVQSIPKLEKALCNQAVKLLRNLEFMLGQELRGDFPQQLCWEGREPARTDITSTHSEHRETSQCLGKHPERVPEWAPGSQLLPRYCWCCCHGQDTRHMELCHQHSSDQHNPGLFCLPQT